MTMLKKVLVFLLGISHTIVVCAQSDNNGGRRGYRYPNQQNILKLNIGLTDIARAVANPVALLTNHFQPPPPPLPRRDESRPPPFRRPEPFQPHRESEFMNHHHNGHQRPPQRPKGPPHPHQAHNAYDLQRSQANQPGFPNHRMEPMKQESPLKATSDSKTDKPMRKNTAPLNDLQSSEVPKQEESRENTLNKAKDDNTLGVDSAVLEEIFGKNTIGDDMIDFTTTTDSVTMDDYETTTGNGIFDRAGVDPGVVASLLG